MTLTERTMDGTEMRRNQECIIEEGCSSEEL